MQKILVLSANHSIPLLTFLSHRRAKVRIRTNWPTTKKATSVEGSNVKIFVHNKLLKFQRTATCLSQCMTFLYYRLIVFAHHIGFNFNMLAKSSKNRKQWTSLLSCFWVLVYFFSTLYFRMLLTELPNPNPSVMAQTWSLKMEALSWGSSVQEIPLTVTWEFYTTISQLKRLFG